MLSEKLLQKVRAKERTIQESRMALEDPETIRKRSRAEQLVEVVNFLHANFATARHPSVFLDSTIAKFV